MFRLVFVLAVVGLIWNPIKAHHEAAVGGPGIAGPIVTFPARTLPKGRFFVSAGLKYTNFDKFSKAQVDSLLRRRETTGQISQALIPSLGLGYGITDDWDIYLNLPYQFKFDLIETDDGVRTEFGDSSGLGDLLLLTQYRFLKLNRTRLYSSVLAGINIPTGFTDVKTNQRDFFGNDDQPGSGTFDPLAGLAISKDFGQAFSLDTNFLYRFSLKGPRDNTIGDSFNYNLALSYYVQHDRLQEDKNLHVHTHSHGGYVTYHSHSHEHGDKEHNHKLSPVGTALAKILPGSIFGLKTRWNLISEINYSWQARPEDDRGVLEDNHGGHLVQATEGLRMIFNDNLITNLGISFPLVTGFNGAQPSPSPSLVFGLSYLL